MFVWGLLGTVLCIAAAPEGALRLAVIQKAADFSLTTQAGETLRLSGLKGKVLLVSFVFTTCNGTCPATTHRMGQVQQLLKERGQFKDGRVRLLSISLDPVRDTPEVLRGYMRLYDADPATWTWIDATYNAAHTSDDNDEYEAALTPVAKGAYGYAYRFSGDGGKSWSYCDTTGSPFAAADVGQLMVQ